jgi:hypothetical protein
MADRKPTQGKSWASPGLDGAIKDVISSTASYIAPRSIKERKVRLQQEEDNAMGRMREGQSTDSNNNY